MVSKQPVGALVVVAYGVQLEQVDNITYLGTNVNNSWEMRREIRVRIEKARAVFFCMKKVLCSQSNSVELKLRLDSALRGRLAADRDAFEETSSIQEVGIQ